MDEPTQKPGWRRCSACRNPIEHKATYWVCSVSTCNRKRTALAFCSVSCWDAHLPVARHREAWAEERVAPSRAQAEAVARPERRSPSPAAPPKQRILVRPPTGPEAEPDPEEILIIASRLKDYVRARSGFNTSERVLRPLSDLVRRVCDDAIKSARREGRRTVLDRDMPKP